MTRSLPIPEAPEETPEGAETPGRTAPEGLDRFRIVLAAAMGSVLVTYAMLVVPALIVVLTGPAGSLDAAFAAAVPLWLAAHQIPLELEGHPLGVLPLLPTLLVVAVVAAGARWSVRRLGGRFRQDAGPVIAASAGAHAAVAVLGSALLPSTAAVGAAPWAAMIGAGIVAGIGAAFGVVRVCGLPDDWSARLRGWPAAGLAAAAIGGIALLLLGALTLFLGLLFGAGRAHDMFVALAPNAGAALGITLLAVAYLPNGVVAGASWLLGPGVDIGLGSWTPLGGAPVPLPPFPLLAALPTVHSPAWALVVVLLPVLVGLGIGGVVRSVLGAAAPLGERLRAVAVATGTLAVVAALVAVLAGGRLAGGPFDPVSIPAAFVLLAVLVWIGGPAAVVALVQRGGPPADGRELQWYQPGYVPEGEDAEDAAPDHLSDQDDQLESDDRDTTVDDHESATDDLDHDLDTAANDLDDASAEDHTTDLESADATADLDPADPTADHATADHADDGDALAADEEPATSTTRRPRRGNSAPGSRAVERARARREERTAKPRRPARPSRAASAPRPTSPEQPDAPTDIEQPAAEQPARPDQPAHTDRPAPAEPADDTPTPPRTVAELVALRERQAREAHDR